MTSSGDPAITVRCLHDVIAVDDRPVPFDRIQLRVHYPAHDDGSDEVRMSGVMPAASADAPWPVVIIVPGVNIAPEAYRWLAVALARRNYVVVTYSWVDMLFGDHRGLTPGLDLELAHRDRYGTGPTATAVAPVLEHLAAPGPVLDGRLDLTRVALGGHSGGGTVALQSASPDWVTGLRAVFAYASHTMTATALGWPPGTMAPVPPGVPVLLMAGADDGVIAASRSRYGIAEGDHDPVRLTWDDAIDPATAGSYVRFAGASHFSFTDPFDPTSGRSFLEVERPTPAHDEALRSLLGRVVATFLDEHVAQRESTGPAVPDLVAGDPLVEDHDHRFGGPALR
jgi:predicted dienelactone hydrolase